MKPIKLKFRGFLTYKNETEIDFRDLYDKKIFVISGDTGSGKTSIFDAISYALYGEVARDIPTDRLRSDFLNPEDPYTFVNLIFEADGKVYEIERIPSQRAKKTKIGQAIKNTAALYDITDEKKLLAEKITDVKNKIQEIIGLDKTQFSKVMLLAQGEFQKFLLAKSDERTKLLGDIFKTYEYKEIQDKIKEKSSEASKSLELIDEKLESTIYRFDEIAGLIKREDLIVHDFGSLKNDITRSQSEKEARLADLAKEEEVLAEKEKTLISQKEQAKNLNENIERYHRIRENYSQKKEEKEAYENLKNALAKASYASSIKVYEKRFDDLVSSIGDNEQRLVDLQNMEADLNEKLKVISLDFEDLENMEDQANKIRINLNESKKMMADYENFEKIKSLYLELEEADNNTKEKEIRLKELAEESQKINQNIGEINQEISGLTGQKSNIQEDTFAIKNKLADIEKELDMSQKNEASIKSIGENKDKIEGLSKKLLALEEDLRTYYKNQRLNEINKLIDDMNASGICPVCGEIHEDKFPKHQVLEIDNEKITDDILTIRSKIRGLESENQLLEKSLIETRSIAEIESLLAKEKENLSEHEDKLTKTDKDIKASNEKLANIKDQSQKIENESKLLKNNLEEANKDRELYEETRVKYLGVKDKFENLNPDKINEEISESSTRLSRTEEKIKDIRETFASINTQIAENKSNIANTRENLENLQLSKEEAEAEFIKKREESFVTVAEYKEALAEFDELKQKETEIEEYFNELARLEILLENYSTYEGKAPVDISKIDDEIINLSQILTGNREQSSALKVSLADISQTLRDLESLEIQYNESSKENEILARLAKIADGSISKVAGREKIDFETFVLTYYFNKVLAYANSRLHSMTKGQFSMRRAQAGLDGRSKWGLDIEIIDANTGKARPTTTLSGGESFLASLALALGLSDEIAAENGGIKIDTLFIDEGFGTLSDDYLSKVIEQIEKLSYENKFIGLISHVKDLKDAIDGKILVTYTADQGSFIEVKT